MWQSGSMVPYSEPQRGVGGFSMSLQGVTRYENVSASGSQSLGKRTKSEFKRPLNANDLRAISAQALAASKQGRPQRLGAANSNQWTVPPGSPGTHCAFSKTSK